MANDEQLALLKQGAGIWNEWRRCHPDVKPDLSDAILVGVDIRQVNLNDADLTGAFLDDANLKGAHLDRADFTEANLRAANLSFAHLWEANFNRARLPYANLSASILRKANFVLSEAPWANLSFTNFTEARILRVDLSGAVLVNTNLTRATLADCRIYGISAWNVILDGAEQSNLAVNPSYEPHITVDDLGMAQFVYLMLNNQNVRRVIDTITSKAVLILGRFTPERKAVLDSIREELRRRNYVPIVFDCDPTPANRDLTETIYTLAGMSRLVIADLTDARSVGQELSTIVPNLPSVAVIPICHRPTDQGYAMFEHWMRFPWVLPLRYYDGEDELLAGIDEEIIEPAERKVNEMRRS